ncbi:DNA-binding transcriptional regulator, LysR family [Desulfatibacillum alkenivorans DSM 16219]|jgi:DNA-binding transcriptional LysR family regulator|uniref:DNA-binding transcriptional regulator, LysR family n=1 Tax=Desulfatibacillum alkenivorans DSM 16219 TaxID=1121393 RepID=A0A1M6MFF1_9BACT|nr:LysR family transcriptional regulator [Desulfatibacillum alkenivorans]SHJ82167.1 DNA-binding transcriptional regulator, LysR family [Desulfatibacillum alkenivorans DSM 16219]
MLPDFNRLKLFYHVYARRSVAGAARDLHVTQSAVSQGLAKLEEELETPLFTRVHKGIVPTPAAESLFSMVKPFVEALERELRSFAASKKQPWGVLRVGSPRMFGKIYMLRVFASFREKYPEVSFVLELGGQEKLLNMVRAGDLDFTFSDIFFAEKADLSGLRDFAVEPVIEEEVILACSTQYYEERIRGDHSLKHLLTLDYLAFRPDQLILRGWFKHHFKRQAPRLNISLTVDNIQAVIAAIDEHMGLGVIASHLAWEQISRGDITAVHTNKPPISNTISLVQLANKVPSLTEKVFLRHFHKSMAAMEMHKDFFKLWPQP